MFISTFPENGELALKSLLNIYSFTSSIPFNIVYDENRKTYLAQIGIIQKTISRIRRLLQLLRWIITIVIGSSSPSLQVPGPMRSFIACLALTVYLFAVIFDFVVSSKRFQTAIVNLFNLIKCNGRRSPSHAPVQKQRCILSKINFPLVEVYLTYGIGIIIPIYDAGTSLFNSGAQAAVHGTWLTLNPSETETADELSSWKRVTGFLFLVADFDANVLLCCSLILLLNAASTLNCFAGHFTERIKKSKEYCVISRAEILSHYFKLRKAFLMLGESLSPLTFIAVVTGGLYSCIAFIWVGLDTRGNSLTTRLAALFVYLGYFVWFLLLASQASGKLQYISTLVCSGGQSQLVSLFPRASETKLLKLATIYEVNSGSIGIRVLDGVIIKYSFTALVIITILANTTIVLQSMDILKTLVASLN